MTETWDPSGTSGSVAVKNTGQTLAFFVELGLSGQRGMVNGLPTTWSQRYLPLLAPGDTRTVTFRNRPSGSVLAAQCYNECSGSSRTE